MIHSLYIRFIIKGQIINFERLIVLDKKVWNVQRHHKRWKMLYIFLYLSKDHNNTDALSY